jgi:Trk K+ transport system NAD-binding subunit
MKVVAYNIKPFEKEFLAKANQKKHDITLIANPLGQDTIVYAEGKDAVIVFTNDDVSASVIKKLANLGIKYILTRSVDTNHIDKKAAATFGIKIANIPSYPLQQDIPLNILQEVANQTIKNLDLWQANKCIGDACQCAKTCKIDAVKKSKSV